jgi:hypothetical protein
MSDLPMRKSWQVWFLVQSIKRLRSARDINSETDLLQQSYAGICDLDSFLTSVEQELDEDALQREPHYHDSDGDQSGIAKISNEQTECQNDL